MADKKISALTSATTPLAGTEVLPVVQSGTTVKVSVANLTVGRDVTNKTSSVQSGTTGGAFFNVSDSGVGASRFWKTQNDVSAYGDWGIYQSTDNTGAAYTARLYFDAAGNPTVSTGNLIVGTAGKGIDFSANTGATGMTSELLNWYEEGNYTPTVAATTGSITSYTATAYYTRIGRQVTVTSFVTITNSGTGAGTLTITLPFTASGSIAFAGTGRENALTGNALQANISAGGTVMNVVQYNNVTVIATSAQVRSTVTYFV